MTLPELPNPGVRRERDPESAGDGPGLSLVDALVREFGNPVTIDDRELRGVVVAVELPLAGQ